MTAETTVTANPKPNCQRSTSSFRYKAKSDPRHKLDQRRLASSQRRTTPNFFGTAYLRITKLIRLHQPASCKSQDLPKNRGRPNGRPLNLPSVRITLFRKQLSS